MRNTKNLPVRVLPLAHTLSHPFLDPLIDPPRFYTSYKQNRPALDFIAQAGAKPYKSYNSYRVYTLPFS